jgi:hypothetical protein
LSLRVQRGNLPLISRIASGINRLLFDNTALSLLNLSTESKIATGKLRPRNDKRNPSVQEHMHAVT